MNIEALSPSLQRGVGPAFELKYLLGPEVSVAEEWARANLTPDPHGVEGRYRTTSLYCDTAARDVFFRTPGFRRNKYRLRRYGDGDLVHLERKTRRGDKVNKRRDVIALNHLPQLAADDMEADWAGGWFVRQVRFRALRPAARIAYDRTAFTGPGMRLTIDRELQGELASAWDLSPVAEGRPLVPGQAVLELKFQGMMPGLFRDLLTRLPNQLPGGVSKYRLCMQAQGAG